MESRTNWEKTLERVALHAPEGTIVARAKIPHMRPRADAILWGERVFFLKIRENGYRYVEGLLYATPHAMVEINEQGET